jgi:hypothetical protein
MTMDLSWVRVLITHVEYAMGLASCKPPQNLSGPTRATRPRRVGGSALLDWRPLLCGGPSPNFPSRDSKAGGGAQVHVHGCMCIGRSEREGRRTCALSRGGGSEKGSNPWRVEGESRREERERGWERNRRGEWWR